MVLGKRVLPMDKKEENFDRDTGLMAKLSVKQSGTASFIGYKGIAHLLLH